MTDYPSNTKRDQKESPEPKKIERVVSGEVKRRKKPLGRRFMETFFGGEDVGTVGQYILTEVMLPRARDLVFDAISQGFERKLYGTDYRRGRPRSGGGGGSQYTSYNRIAPNDRFARREEPSREISSMGRSRHDFDEIILDHKHEAEDILTQLYDIISQFEVATVADLYQMAGISVKYTEADWGWTSLQGSQIVRIKDGYLLDLPRPISLNQRR